MDAWLAELETILNDDPILINKFQHEQDQHIIDTLDEELAAVLGDDFYFNNDNNLCPQNNISSLLNCTPKNPNNNLLSSQSILNCPIIVPNISQIDYIYDIPNSIEPIMTNDQQSIINDPPNDNNGTSTKICNDENAAKIGGKKKRRDPDQVHGHIMAERKRRELLTQRFIALSAMVPGLKKVDKTSILGEAIKHLQNLQEKVKMLEEATNNQVVGPMMVVKRTQLIMDKDNESIVVENVNGSTCSSGGSDGEQNDTLLEIEVKVTSKSILLRICCVKRKGILAKIYQEVENHAMIVLNTSVITFESSSLDITILAQMEGAKGGDKQVKDLLRSLNYELRRP